MCLQYTLSLLFSIRRKRRLKDLQVLVVILCIRPTGWFQGGVLQAEAWEVWRPLMRTKGGSCSHLQSGSWQAASECPGLANRGDPLDVGAIRHTVAFFIRCKIWNIYTKHVESINNVNWALDLLIFRCLNKATLKSGRCVYKTAFKKDLNSASLSPFVVKSLNSPGNNIIKSLYLEGKVLQKLFLFLTGLASWNCVRVGATTERMGKYWCFLDCTCSICTSIFGSTERAEIARWA